MQRDFPKVSIIIPVHNKAQYLKEAVYSALEQTWTNIEVIAINDASTDDSRPILRSINDSRLAVYDVNFGNASAARNYGLTKSSGKFIQFLDADDVIDPQKIELQLKDMNLNETALGVCNTKTFFKGDESDDRELDTAFLSYSSNPADFLLNLYGDVNKGMVQPNAWLVPKAITDKAGEWNTDLSLDDDGEFFCRVMLNSEKIVHTDKVLNWYRRFKADENFLSGTTSETAMRSALLSAQLKKKHIFNFVANREVEKQKAVNALFLPIAISTYSKYHDISLSAQKEISGKIKTSVIMGGGVINIIAKIFGWKNAARIRHFKNKLTGNL